MDQVKIGKYIASRRKAAGLTQMQLAEKLGMSNKSVSKWERGVCLPDVSVYEDLCSVLGMSINEFIAGEDIEPEHVADQAERNIIDVSRTGKVRSQRLKTCIAILIAVVIGMVFWLLNEKGMFRRDFIDPYDRSSDEYNTATILLEPGQASPFHYSVGSESTRLVLTVHRFKGDTPDGEPEEISTELTEITDRGSVHDGAGTIASVINYREHKLKLIATNAATRYHAETEIGTDIENFDEMGMAVSETEPLENIQPDKEYALCGYYFDRQEIGAVPPEDALKHYSKNPSGADYTVIVTARFEGEPAEQVVVPDLIGMTHKEAVNAIDIELKRDNNCHK